MSIDTERVGSCLFRLIGLVAVDMAALTCESLVGLRTLRRICWWSMLDLGSRLCSNSKFSLTTLLLLKHTNPHHPSAVSIRFARLHNSIKSPLLGAAITMRVLFVGWFTWPPYQVECNAKVKKNSEVDAIRCTYSFEMKCTKTEFSAGALPDTTWGAYDASDPQLAIYL